MKKRINQSVAIASLLDSMKYSECILELGANVGLITSKLIKSNKPVYAFEPEPVAFEELSKIKAINLKIYNSAAWNTECELNFYRHKNWKENKSTTSSTLIKSKTNVDARNLIRVSAIDISSFISKIENNILIKMDVEGAEYEILNHLLNSKVMNKIFKIYCEFHPEKIKYGKIKHFFLMIRLYISGNNKKVVEWF